MYAPLITALSLFNSLDPSSIAQTLAFYELYPNHVYSLDRASKLLNNASKEEVDVVTSVLNRSSQLLSTRDVQVIEKLASHLPNRHLKGYWVTCENEIIHMASEEIDIGMALLLSQLEGKENAHFQARCYSALLDLMALQILAHLPKSATSLEKIQETNRFIFDQMHFKFPPHSVYAERIDLYTFLPSVMDNHLGVCLGVTTLYLALAQRIDLPLEIVTPPGHIYIRYREGKQITNIETTARGVNLSCETYLNVNTSCLKLRTLKEVIGMTHVNQASTYLHVHQYDNALISYEKAHPYMPDDPLVQELLGYTYLFTGEEEKGKMLLKAVVRKVSNEMTTHYGIAQDYLDGKVGLEGIGAIFSRVDETRDSILEKQKELQKILKQFPNFREGLHQLAVSWIQLSRAKEAIQALEQYYEIDSKNPTISYYLAVLHAERRDFKSSWRYLKQTESITAHYDFSPRALGALKELLTINCPE